MLWRGSLGSVLVLLGGVEISVLPRSTPILRWPALAALHADGRARVVGYAVVVAGLLLLISAWLRLLRRLRADAASGVPETARVGLTRVAALAWASPLLVAPPLFSKDGWAYAAQGMLVHRGLSPYVVGPGVLHGPIRQAVDPQWWFTPSPYGPLPLWLGSLGAGLTGDPWVLVLGHRLIALVGVLLLAWAVPRLARWCGTDPALASGVVLAGPLVLGEGVGGLHNDLLMTGLMAAALVVAGRGRPLGRVVPPWMAGAVLAGLAAADKAPGGVVVVVVAIVSLVADAGIRARLVRLAAAGGVALATLVLSGLLTGVGLGWVHSLWVPGSVWTPLSVTTVVGHAVGLDTTLHDLGSLLTLVVLAWVALRTPTGERAAAVRAAALVAGAVLALSPVVHPWYLLWVLPLLAALRLSARVAAGLAALQVVVALTVVVEGTSAPLYVGLCLAGWAALAVRGLLGLRRSRLRPDSRPVGVRRWPAAGSDHGTDHGRGRSGPLPLGGDTGRDAALPRRGVGPAGPR